ncbi:uncharacterized protein LOC126846093 [Adelges cooleyi]|uniref:uncharacterized protein LOC126846093 n=1 Tax=Adelges cooleyi TaxID=133065 RepID=UPI00217FDED6|nr:uncharacterized protein LOC126846093 [Adelges cooleyi]
MYQLPYVILKITLLSAVIAEPVLRETLTAAAAANGQATAEDTGGSSNDDEKTLSEQILEGKYGLIHTELFNSVPSRPGVLSYNINPEVPKDNVNNLGGLDPEEIWLAENHLLVLKGGNFTDQDVAVSWPYIDNYIAPPRQVKIPDNPKVPPPFPVQLEDGGPVDFVRVNGSTWTPMYPPNFPPFLPSPPPNGTFDEDDQSLYYPPKYDFVYAQENSTRVPPGPLVPGIVLPPPPDFFAPLQKQSKPKKINLDTSKTIPRFNQKPYFKMPKVNHNVKILSDHNNWVPITGFNNYVDGPQQNNNPKLSTTALGYNYGSQQLFPTNPTADRPDTYYYYDSGSGGYDNSYDVEKPGKHNKYVDPGTVAVKSQKKNPPRIVNDKSTTGKPYYEYNYVASDYGGALKSQPIAVVPASVPPQQVEYGHQQSGRRPEWSSAETPKSVYPEPSRQPLQQQHQQEEQYSDVLDDYGVYQTDRPSYGTDNPYHAFFTQDDASLVDENTKKYFALFGQKVKTEKTVQVTSTLSPPAQNYHSNKPKVVSLIDDVAVNYKRPRPTDPDSEIVTQDPRPCSPDKIKLQQPTTRPFSQQSLFDDVRVNYQQQPLRAEQVTKLTPLYDDVRVNYRQPVPPRDPDSEYVTSLKKAPPISLADDTQVNYKRPLPTINPNAEFAVVTLRPYVAEQVTQRPPLVNPVLFDQAIYNGQPSRNPIAQRPSYAQNVKTNNAEPAVTQRPYINVLPYNDGQGLNYNERPLQKQRPTVEVTTTERPYLQGHNSYLEDALANYQLPHRNRPNTADGLSRPRVKFPQTSLIDDVRVNYKLPLPTKNRDAEYFTQRPPAHVHPPVSLIGDTQVNYKQPLPAKDPDAEYINIVSTQRPVNRVVSYNLPGNSGSHFFFLTTHTGHPIQYNLGPKNYQYFKRNVK